MAQGATLRRYTTALALLDLLNHKRLTLLNPARWYDQNDALGLRRYSQLVGEGAVFAACFAEGSEQAHHWQIFAGDAHGVAIIFDKERLLSAFDVAAERESILHGPVQYKSLKDVREMAPIEKDILPFLKRDTFKAENEYRVVAWEIKFLAGQSYHIPINLGCIERVVLGPSMPDSLGNSLREIATRIDGCTNIKFTKSGMVNDASWAKAISEGLVEAKVSELDA